MRTLITGADGFAGSYLVPALEAAGGDVRSVRHPAAAPRAWGRSWTTCDLRDRARVAALVRESAPARIVHLAALAFPPAAARAPLEALRVNYLAVDHLLAAIAEHAPDARLLYVGSGEVYGARPAGSPPLDESAPLHPRTGYAATKAAAEARVRLAVASGLDAVCARPFNHSGPRRPSDYAESAFARQVARCERGAQEPVIRVGNLEPVRDFSDVRDVVAAYALLLERGERGAVYNVCSGRGWRIGAVLEHLLALSERDLRIERDPERYRESAPERLALVGDAGRLRALGWEPAHPFEETLSDLLEDWRSRA